MFHPQRQPADSVLLYHQDLAAVQEELDDADGVHMKDSQLSLFIEKKNEVTTKTVRGKCGLGAQWLAWVL